MSEIALVGKKIGMTREFYKTGQSVPVTVLKMETGRVIQVIEQDKRGYKAVQIGFGKIKNNKLSKAMKGYFAKKNTEPKKTLKEFRLENIENFKEGNEIGLEIFENVKFVDVKSKTLSDHGPNIYEVELLIKGETKVQDDSLFVIEGSYCGIFTIENADGDILEKILYIKTLILNTRIVI